MISSLVIFGIYLTCAITTLVMTKGKLSLISRMIMLLYFYSFVVKAASDSLRYYDMELTVMNLITTLTWISDRLNIFAVIYLSFLVKEVQIEITSNTIKDMLNRSKRFALFKIVIYFIYAVLTIPIIVMLFLRLTKFSLDPHNVAMADVVCKSLFLCVDLLLIGIFI